MEYTAESADQLVMWGVARECPDCGDDQIFVPVDDDPSGRDTGAYCCATCGAAILVDLLAAPATAAASGAA
jgi:hypothetical protein